MATVCGWGGPALVPAMSTRLNSGQSSKAQVCEDYGSCQGPIVTLPLNQMYDLEQVPYLSPQTFSFPIYKTGVIQTVLTSEGCENSRG